MNIAGADVQFVRSYWPAFRLARTISDVEQRNRAVPLEVVSPAPLRLILQEEP